mgnify:CR=1 FL=1
MNERADNMNREANETLELALEPRVMFDAAAVATAAAVANDVLAADALGAAGAANGDVSASGTGAAITVDHAGHAADTNIFRDVSVARDDLGTVTLSVTGAAGLPPLSMAGNSLRSDTTLRLSFRLPPTAKTENILPALQKKLLTDPPFNAVVSIAGGDALPGWNAPSEADWFRSACDESSKALWGKPPMRIGEGGSIPILNLFEAQFPRAQFAVTGVLDRAPTLITLTKVLTSPIPRNSLPRSDTSPHLFRRKHETRHGNPGHRGLRRL